MLSETLTVPSLAVSQMVDAEIKWLAESNTASLWQSQKLIQELLIPIHCLNHKTVVSSNLYYYFVPLYVVCPHHALLKLLSVL